MMKTFKIAALATSAIVASAYSAAASEPLDGPVTAPEQVVQPQLCENVETLVFSASSTQDKFGYSIAVCVLPGVEGAEDRVTVVESGEGGNLRTSCLASACTGVIEFNRYTRFRFTELTLKWRSEYADNRIIETFDAHDVNADPSSSVAHFWLSEESKRLGYEATREELAGYEPLSLIKAEKSLPGA